MDARNFEFGETKDLGWENGWGLEKPQEYKDHIGKAGHEVTSIKLGRCQTRYTCHTCGITWAVDSSD